MFYTALVLGLLGSFHCLGMCGPIAFVLPLDRTNKIKAFSQTFLYHLGRIISYCINWIALWALRQRTLFKWFTTIFIYSNWRNNDFNSTCADNFFI